MAQVETWFNQDIKQAVKVRYLDGNVFSMDNSGNIIGVNVYDGGEPATLGGTVSANIIRSDGVTVAAVGTLSGNKAYVVLPQDAYTVPGVISIIIKLTSGTNVTTLCAIVANVYLSSTDSVVDPGTIIPSIETLIAEIEAAVASIPADYSDLWTTLAPAFSSSDTYNIGQYCTYDGGLYRFIHVHTGSWSSSDVVPVTVGGDLFAVRSAFDALSVNNENSNYMGLWVRGTVVFTATGNVTSSTTRLATEQFVPEEFLFAYTKATGYNFGVYGYDASGVFKGSLNPTNNTWGTSGTTWITFIDFTQLRSKFPGYTYRITFRNTAGANMPLTDYANLVMISKINYDLLCAKAKGLWVEESNYSIPYIFKNLYLSYAAGTLEYRATHLSTLSYVFDNIDFVLADNGYDFEVAAYDSSSNFDFVGVYNGSTYQTSSGSWHTFVDLSQIRNNNPSYKYRIVFRDSGGSNLSEASDYVHIRFVGKANHKINISSDNIENVRGYNDTPSPDAFGMGFVSYANGTVSANSTYPGYMHTVGYIPDSVTWIHTDAGYEFGVFAYDNTGTYKGMYHADGLHTDASKYWDDLNFETVRASYPAYNFIVSVRKTSGNINPVTDYIYVHFRYKLLDAIYELGGYNIPSYWASEMATKLSQIHANEESVGENGDAFVFITDTHMPNFNFGVSPELVKLIISKTSVRKIVHGGDVVQGDDGSTAAVVNSMRAYRNIFRPFDAVYIRGNHDAYESVTENQFYSVFDLPIQDRINTNGKLYFYRDNPSQKIRYIFLNSYTEETSTTMPAYFRTMLDWMGSAISELQAGWSVIVFVHVYCHSNLTVTNNGEWITDELDTISGTASAKIIAVIVGHCHNDFVDDDNHPYLIIGTTCDANGAQAALDTQNPTRTKGTTTEQAFDVFFIDKANSTIKTVRIGAGSNRTIPFVS